MKNTWQFSGLPRLVVLTSVLLVGIHGATMAQALQDIQPPKTPLVLQAQGSFFVGGEKADQTHVELGSFGPAGHISVNQMYVRYLIPVGGERKLPVVMVHGMTLTGKTWETTPDGRMGWDEYFVRKRHSTYVVDQVGRGRSGFNQAIFNNVRAGLTTPLDQQPRMRRFSDENVWPNFRFGPKPGVAYPDAQFPVAAVGELSKQGIPDLNLALPNPNPNFKALSDLAIQLKQTVLMGHSQSGAYPLEAALVNPAGIKGMVLVEPGSCPAYTDQQITTLAKLPILVVFGDHLGDVPTGIPGHSWKTTAFDSCQALVTRVNAVGGKAQMLYPPDKGIKGNSHMIMQDKNNLQIADLILKWIDERVDQPKARGKSTRTAKN